MIIAYILMFDVQLDQGLRENDIGEFYFNYAIMTLGENLKPQRALQ